MERQTAYSFGGEGNKARTAETGGAAAAVVQTRGSIRAFLFSGDKKYPGNTKCSCVRKVGIAHFINPELPILYTAHSVH